MLRKIHHTIEYSINKIKIGDNHCSNERRKEFNLKKEGIFLERNGHRGLREQFQESGVCGH